MRMLLAQTMSLPLSYVKQLVSDGNNRNTHCCHFVDNCHNESVGRVTDIKHCQYQIISTD